jgi:hypothetical protein
MVNKKENKVVNKINIRLLLHKNIRRCIAELQGGSTCLVGDAPSLKQFSTSAIAAIPQQVCPASALVCRGSALSIKEYRADGYAGIALSGNVNNKHTGWAKELQPTVRRGCLSTVRSCGPDRQSSLK